MFTKLTENLCRVSNWHRPHRRYCGGPVTDGMVVVCRVNIEGNNPRYTSVGTLQNTENEERDPENKKRDTESGTHQKYG